MQYRDVINSINKIHLDRNANGFTQLSGADYSSTD